MFSVQFCSILSYFYLATDWIWQLSLLYIIDSNYHVPVNLFSLNYCQLCFSCPVSYLHYAYHTTFSPLVMNSVIWWSITFAKSLGLILFQTVGHQQNLFEVSNSLDPVQPGQFAHAQLVFQKKLVVQILLNEFILYLGKRTIIGPPGNAIQIVFC